MCILNNMSLKQPPTFDPSRGDCYQDWKTDVEIWGAYTRDEKSRRGPAVYLSLQGEAREAVRTLQVQDLATDDGLTMLLAELDKVYLKEETTRAFCAVKSFVEFRRVSGVNFTKFLVEFNNKYREVQKFKLELPDGLKGYFLLSAANLSADHERLVRATAALTFDDIKDKLQKVFGEFGDEEDDDTGVLPIKTESAFYTNSSTGKRGRGGQALQRGARGGRGFQGARRTNPLDADGNIMRCHECESTRHFVADCPERKKDKEGHPKNENANMTVHIALVAGMSDNQGRNSLGDTIGKGVLDSACTKSVAGELWIKEFVDTLDETERRNVEQSERKSMSLFRFGDGKESKSKRELTVPLFIGGKVARIEIDVVENEIPLLIGLPTMTELGMLLDTVEHRVTIGDYTQKLEFNAAGHYVIPVSKWTVHNCKMVIDDQKGLVKCSKQEMRRKAEKLHRQFAHASKERLLRLLKDGGCTNSDFLAEVEKCCDECSFCLKYRKPKPRPIIGFPKAQEFNGCVSMDLKEVTKGKVWILHLIDEATRYTAAAVIYRKKTVVVVEKILQIWIAYFGAPEKMHSDNGGEFSSEVMRDMHNKFNIETSTTPGEAPYSNGTVERNNALLYETTMKTKEDEKCSLETALAWAVSAKNSLQNRSGFSPNQLVLSRNGNFPSIDSNKIPAMEPNTSSDVVRENLNALHSARKNYIIAESSDRIKRAMRKNVRTYTEVEFVPGEKVYYKRKARKGWSGPAKVLGKESNFVLVRHGGAFFRCHPCQLLKIESSSDVIRNKVTRDSPQSRSGNQNTQLNIPVKDSFDSDSDSEDEQEQEGRDPAVVQDSDSEDEQQQEGRDPAVVQESEQTTEEPVESEAHINSEVEQEGRDDLAFQEVNQDTEQETEIPLGSERGNSEFQEVSEIVPEEMGAQDNVRVICERLKKSDTKPRRNTVVQYALRDGHTQKAKVMYDQPKKGGENSDWVNVQLVGTDVKYAVDWRQVLWWREDEGQISQVLTVTVSEENRTEIVEAKEREFQNLLENDVFEWVADEGGKVVSTKWVITEKTNPDGSRKVKARLVARGFEEHLTDKRVDSPTVSRQSLRLIFTAASTMGWELHSLDIASAFLQGKEIQRTVLVRPPKEFAVFGRVWRLKRCLYGLSDAPREWYNKVEEKLTELGGQVSLYDQSMFLWHEGGKLVGIVVAHVDDFTYCGTMKWLEGVMGEVFNGFKISRSNKGAFKYIGLNIEQAGDKIYVDQSQYIATLEKIEIRADRKKQINDSLTQEEKGILRSVCGQLLWVTSQTRPDVSFEGCILSNYGKSGTVKSLVEANKAIKCLKSKEVQLVFPGLGNPDQLKVVAYGDGSHNSLPNGDSQGGHIVFIQGNERAAPISWKSKKLDRVTKSPLATEISAIADTADYAYLVAAMLKEMFALEELPKIVLMTDSKSLKDNLESTRVIDDPRQRVDVARLKQMVRKGEIRVQWVPGRLQLADSLTKRGASPDCLLEVLSDGSLKSLYH